MALVPTFRGAKTANEFTKGGGNLAFLHSQQAPSAQRDRGAPWGIGRCRKGSRLRDFRQGACDYMREGRSGFACKASSSRPYSTAGKSPALSRQSARLAVRSRALSKGTPGAARSSARPPSMGDEARQGVGLCNISRNCINRHGYAVSSLDSRHKIEAICPHVRRTCPRLRFADYAAIWG